MKNKKFVPIVTGLFLLLQYFSPLMMFIPARAEEPEAPPVCTYDFVAQKMWKVTWGYDFADRNGGVAKFNMQSNGGLTSLNGGAVPSYMSSNPNWHWLNITESQVNTHYDYGFADGTLRTADITFSDVGGCRVPTSIVWGQSFLPLDSFPSTNALNKANNHQYVEQATTASGKVSLKFINPTAFTQYFEVRQDDAASTSTDKYGPCRMGIMPLNGACNGKRYLSADDLSYPIVKVLPNSTETRTYTVNNNVAVRVTFGPERDWDFDWTVFIPHDQPKQVTLVAPTSPVKHKAPTTMKWATDDTNIKEFIYQRFENDTCSGAAAHTKGGLTVKTYTDPTLAMENFSWHIKTISNDPLAAQGPWSECFKVTVDKIQPVQVQLVSPENNAIVNSESGVKHTWTTTDDDVQEFIYISTYDEAGTQRRSSKGGLTIPEYTDMTPSETGDVYYWMVKTTDNAGNQGPWSQKWKVIVDNTPPAGTVNGLKFNDLNGNGQRENGEPGIENWMIKLWQEDRLVKQTTTDENGNYQFLDVPVGTYKVTEENEKGWKQTTPQDTNYCMVTVVRYGEQSCEFGNYKYGVIDGQKFEDKNGNGQWDEQDSGIEGWTIELSDGVTTKTTQTGANGYYKFDELMAGSYTVSEVQQEGWTQTAPTNNVCTFLVQSGKGGTCLFGNYKLGTISGVKFEDMNGNGVQDENESGLRWGIKLYKDGQLYEKKSTNKYGEYKFSDLGYGNYRVEEVMKPGWAQSAPAEKNCTFTIMSNSDKTCEFGNYRYSSISGMKYKDSNTNGRYNFFESGIKNWDITLWRDANGNGVLDTETDTLIDTDGTNFLGLYSFMKLSPGTYFVSEETRLGWMQTDPGEDGYLTFELESGDSISIFSKKAFFGNIQVGNIQGFKWNDDSGDGIKDFGEPKLSGWTIELYGEGEGDQPGVLIKTTSTDEDGEYLFKGLFPGTYYVKETQQSPWVQTFPSENGYHKVVVDGDIDENSYDFGNNLTPDILGEKTVNLAEVEPGGQLIYNVKMTNVGTEKAEGVVVTDTLPSNVQYFSSDPAGVYNNTTKKVTWTLTGLEPGESWNATVTVVVSANALEDDNVTNSVFGVETCNLDNPEFSTEAELDEPVINYCEDDPTLLDNTASVTTVVKEGDVGGLSTGPDESKSSEGTDAANYEPSVLGASTELSETGKNMLTPVILGLLLMGAIVAMNKRKPEPQISYKIR